MIEIDMMKVSTNSIYSSVHWSIRKKHKEDYLWLVKCAKGLKKIEKYPVKLKFDFIFSRNVLDSSNCTYMGKMVEDALVELGYLKDDCPKYVKSVEYSSRKGKKNKIELEVIENDKI